MSGVHYDVVVVGARVAGASTAMLLARAGLRVLVLDRGVEGSDTLSTHAFMRAGVVQLHRWGLLDDIIAAGTPAISRTVFRYGPATTTVTLKPIAGVAALYAPRRTVLDQLLVDAARAAGAHVRFGVSVTDLVHTTDGRVAGVVAKQADGKRLVVGAATVVGADGRQSRVAQHVGAELERRADHASGFIYGHLADVDTGENGGAAFEWFYGPGATAGVIPTNDGLTCVWVGAPAARFDGLVRLDASVLFPRLLQQVSGALAERVAAARSPYALRVFRGERGWLRRPWGPGWSLVGDAGSFLDPITAHGMSQALRDAELLATALVASLGGSQREAVAMEGYRRTRDRLSGGLFTATDAIASYEWSMANVESHLRAFSAAMAEEVEHLLCLGTDRYRAAAERSVGVLDH